MAYGEINEPRADEYYAVEDVILELSNFIDQMYVAPEDRIAIWGMPETA